MTPAPTLTQPRGELLPNSESAGENAASYAARYASCFKARYTTDRGAAVRVAAPAGTTFLVPGTLVALPDEAGPASAPLVNQLLGRFVMHRADKLDALAKKPRRTKVSAAEDLLPLPPPLTPTPTPTPTRWPPRICSGLSRWPITMSTLA